MKCKFKPTFVIIIDLKIKASFDHSNVKQRNQQRATARKRRRKAIKNNQCIENTLHIGRATGDKHHIKSQRVKEKQNKRRPKHVYGRIVHTRMHNGRFCKMEERKKERKTWRKKRLRNEKQNRPHKRNFRLFIPMKVI